MMKNNSLTLKQYPIDNPQLHLASIVTNSNDAIIGKTLEGIVTSWNPAAERLYGYKAEEIIGNSIQLIYPNNLIKELKQILKKISKGEKIDSFETVRLHKDGTLIDVLITISPIKDESGKVIGASDLTRDFRDRKRMERNQAFLMKASSLLASSLEYNKTLQSVARLAVQDIADWCAVDLLDKKGKVELVAVAHKSPRREKWARELREKLPPNMDEPQGLPQVLRSGKSELYPFLSDEVLEQLVNNPKDLELIHEIGIRSVMIVPLIVRNKVIGAITFVSSTLQNTFDQSSLALAEDLAQRAAYAVDNAILFKTVQEELNERKRVKQALLDSEHKYKRLLESNIIGIFVAKYDGSVVEANQTFLKMIGYTQKELTEGKIKWNEITPQEWLVEDARVIEELKSFGAASPWEKEYFRKDGSRVPVLLGCTILDEKEQTVITFCLDISERKEVERRKDDFISVASHELKTPITSMKVFTQLLERRFSQRDDAQTVSLVNKMDVQLNKLIVLISDLLDVSRIHAGKLELRLEDFSITDLVKECVESLEQTTNHKIKIKNGEQIMVHADPERISQVITNFLTNAIKYSPPETEIIVTIEHTNNSVSVGVRDFGIGIGEEEQLKIFERFYQAKSSDPNTFPGLGMGLYISSEIIQRHSGTIKVKSKKGKGSHFIFTIPLLNS